MGTPVLLMVMNLVQASGRCVETKVNTRGTKTGYRGCCDSCEGRLSGRRTLLLAASFIPTRFKSFHETLFRFLLAASSTTT